MRGDGVFDNVHHRDGLALQGDLALADPRDVEEIVNQPSHVDHLSLDHLKIGRPGTNFTDRGLLHQLQGVANRREWIAQLMRQHGEEFIFPAVRLLECVLGGLAFRDILDDSDDHLERSRFGPDGESTIPDPTQLSIGANDSIFVGGCFAAF